MWKIKITYKDKSSCTLTGSHKEIPLELAVNYFNKSGINLHMRSYRIILLELRTDMVLIRADSLALNMLTMRNVRSERAARVKRSESCSRHCLIRNLSPVRSTVRKNT